MSECGTPSNEPLRRVLGRFLLVEGGLRGLVGFGLLAVHPGVAIGGLMMSFASWGLYRLRHRFSLDALVAVAGANWGAYFTAAMVIFGWDAGFFQQASCLVFAVFLFGFLDLRVRIKMAAAPLVVTPGLVLVLSAFEPVIPTSESGRMALIMANMVISTSLNAAILIHFVRGLIEQRRRLEELAESRQHLIEGLSHELKTPIAAMLTQTQVALRENKADAEATPVLQLIERNLRRMTVLTARMLDISRLQRGSLILEPVDVAPDEFLQACVELHAPLAAQRRVSLEWTADSGPPWRTDPLFLRVALDNLISNAIRHSPVGGAVKIEAGRHPVPQDGHTVWISVADDGQGIDSDHLEQIFEPFFRGDPGRSRQEGAHGLGLSIAQRTLEGMGGNIEVTSEPGEGARFTVHL